MSVVDLFVDRRPTIANITIDATLSEEHSRTADISSYPVEDGPDRAAHRRVHPRTLSITGIVSAVQWNLNYLIRDGAAIDGLDVERHRTAWTLLNSLFDSGEDVLVALDLQTYRRMQITALVASVQPKQREVLRFSASFREVEVAYTTFVAAAAAEVADLAASTSEVGGKQTQPSTPADIAAAQAIADTLGLLA